MNHVSVAKGTLPCVFRDMITKKYRPDRLMALPKTTDSPAQKDLVYFSEELATALRFILISKDCILSDSFLNDAAILLEDYSKFVNQGKEKLPLKTEIIIAITYAAVKGKDPLTATLEAIASRTQDVVDHFRDDTETIQDVSSWLLYEASQPV